ncbi:hypothetical protein FAGKG844_30049 [Frankia sp. AgKG'84/4]
MMHREPRRGDGVAWRGPPVPGSSRAGPCLSPLFGRHRSRPGTKRHRLVRFRSAVSCVLSLKAAAVMLLPRRSR